YTLLLQVTLLISRSQPGYPARLTSLPDPPAALHVRGDLGPLGGRVVAVVGARAASALGLARARAIAAGLAERGVVVLSGGGVGSDGAANAGAMETGGRTAAVVAGGVTSPYPPRNRWLFEAMVGRGGALVSPFPDGTPVRRWSFLARNAVIAGM